MSKAGTPRQGAQIEQSVYGKFLTEVGGIAAVGSPYGFIMRSAKFPTDPQFIVREVLENDARRFRVDDDMREFGMLIILFSQDGMWAVRYRRQIEGEDTAGVRSFAMARIAFVEGITGLVKVPMGVFYHLLSEFDLKVPVHGDPTELPPIRISESEVAPAFEEYAMSMSTPTEDCRRLGWLCSEFGKSIQSSILLKPPRGPGERQASHTLLGLELEAFRFLIADEQPERAIPAIVIDGLMMDGRQGLTYSSAGVEVPALSRETFDSFRRSAPRRLERKPQGDATAMIVKPGVRISEVTVRKIGFDPWPLIERR